jgi:hypothetical protein
MPENVATWEGEIGKIMVTPDKKFPKSNLNQLKILDVMSGACQSSCV